MVEIILLIIFNLIFPVKGGKSSGVGGMKGCFFLDEIDKDIKDRDYDAPISDKDFDDGPDW